MPAAHPLPLSPATRRAALPATTLVQAASSAAVIGPSVAAPLLLPRLQLGPEAVGLFVALVYAGAMLATQVSAFAIQRHGPIRASQAGLLANALGLALLALPQLPLAALGALLIGLGYGPITPASSQMLARTTEARHYALVFSIKQTGVPLGGVIAGLLVPPLAALGAGAGAGAGHGGPTALLGLALLCLLGALAAQPLARAMDAGRSGGSGLPRAADLLAPMRFIVQHPVLRQVAVVSFAFSMVQVSFTAYLVSLLTGPLRWGLAAAGAVLAVAQVAGVVGRITWGWVADRGPGARRMLMALGTAMAACALASAGLSPDTPAWAVGALLAAFGATAVGWNGVYLATVARLVPQPQAAMATAGTLFFTFLGVVIGPPLFGQLARAVGGLGPAFAALALPATVGLLALLRARIP